MDARRKNIALNPASFELSRFGWVIFLFGSVLIHALLFFYVGTPQNLSRLQDSSEPIYVEQVPRRPIVFSDRAPKKALSRDKKDPLFESTVDNEVDHQTQAMASGQYEMGGGLSEGSKGLKVKELSEQGEMTSLDDLAMAKQPMKLPESVDRGVRTLLRTQQASYASFYKRLTESIYGPWVRGVEKVISTSFKEKKTASQYETILKIILSKQGEVLEIHTLQSSGFGLLDRAAKTAIWENDPYLNPPLEKNGEPVALTYSFLVEKNVAWKKALHRLFL